MAKENTGNSDMSIDELRTEDLGNDLEENALSSGDDYTEDPIFNIVTEGQYSREKSSENEQTVVEDASEEMLEEQVAGKDYDETAATSARPGRTKRKRLGKYIIINDKKIENDPHNFAQAIRTMLSKDEE